MVALVGRSLVEPMAGGRYTLHNTLADFAQSLFDEAGSFLDEQSKNEIACQNHADYYWDLARTNVENNWQVVEMEMGQIQRAVEWVLSRSKDKQSWEEKILWAEFGLKLARAVGAKTYEASISNGLGHAYFEKSNWDKALEYYEHSRVITGEIGDRAGLANTFCLIGDIYEEQRRFADAEQVLIQAVAIFEALGSPDLDNARKQLDKVRELQRIAVPK